MYGICFAILIGLYKFVFVTNELNLIWISVTKFLFWWYVVTSVISVGFVFFSQIILDVIKKIIWLKSFTDKKIPADVIRNINNAKIHMYPILIKSFLIISGAFMLMLSGCNTRDNYVLFACGTTMLMIGFIVFPKFFLRKG